MSKTYKPKANSVFVSFNRKTAEKIALLARINSHSIAHTITMLVCIAFKYNYTPDVQYILCEPVAALPTVTDDEMYSYKQFRQENTFRYSTFVTFSQSNFSKIQKLMSLYGYQTQSEAVRSLIDTVFTYDYDESLKFHKPILISSHPLENHSPNTQSKSSRNNDIILLDSF